MKTQLATKSTIGLLLFALAAPKTFGAGESASQPLPRFSHPRDITNPYLPLGALKQDILEGHEGGKKVRVERTSKLDIHKTFKIGGQTVQALTVEDREFENGQLSEVTLDYFAQADDGTVYYLGEDVDQYERGKIVGHEGAWLLGVHTAKPGIFMPAHPNVGDRFRSEDVPKITTEDVEVVTVSTFVRVPAGSFPQCVKTRETSSDGQIDYKYCAPGIGVVEEASADGELLLMSHTTLKKRQIAVKSPTSSAKPPLQDPGARDALGLVGMDPTAEDYWISAINDPTLPAAERSELIEDLNEEGLSDPKHPTVDDLPVIVNRLWLIEGLAWDSMDQVNADAFSEAYKDLLNLAALAQGGGKPVN